MKDINVKSVTAEQAKDLLDSGEAVLIDVRERNEWEAHNIPGATLVPLSSFDPAMLPSAPDKTGIFHCRSGRRTADYFGLFLQGNYRDIVHMEGGILDWHAKGYPVKTGQGT